MAILVTCGTCGAKLRVRDEYSGKEVWCPACKAPQTLTGERVPNHEVFVSYSNKDKAVADAICATLEEKKIRCWIAPRDISAGNSWGGSIIEAIEDAQVMVLVYSGNSNLSPQIIREVERAVAKGLLIVPFRIEAAPMSKDMEYFLSASHWFDALTPPVEQHLAQLAEMVRLLLFRSAKARGATLGTDPVSTAKPHANTVPWKGAAAALLGALLVLGAFLWTRPDQQHALVAAHTSTNVSHAAPSQLQRPSSPSAASTAAGLNTTGGWISQKLPQADRNGWVTLFDGEHLYGCEPTNECFTMGKACLNNDTLWLDDAGFAFNLRVRNAVVRIRAKTVKGQGSGYRVMASIGPYCAWFSGGAHFGEFAIGDTSGKPLCKSKSTFSKKEFIDMEFTMMCGKTTLTIGGVPGVSAETSPSMESDQITVWAINGVVAIKRIEVKELNELPAAQTSSPSTVTPAVAVPLPALQSGQRWTNSLGMIFVPVPGTAVQFAIWDTRVTDFTAFIQATGYDATQGMGSLGKDGWNGRGDSWKSPGFAQGPTHPVCGVSWEDAKAFCEWLTKKERNTGQLQQGQLYRLPTDAEWSVAVGLEEEAGSTPDEKSARSRGAYPWGTQWPPPRGAGNYAGEESKTGAPADWPVISDFDDRFARTSPVGSFSANLFGLYDMGGNVWQLCEDFYKLDQQWRVFRGASWDTNDPDNMRSSFRGWAPPGVRAGAIGFRCVLAGGGVSTAR